MGVVLDLDLGAELADQPIERLALGGTHVGRGDDPQRHAAFAQSLELGLEQPQPVPLHERTEQIHLVCGVDLCTQLGPKAGLVAGVGEQRSI